MDFVFFREKFGSGQHPGRLISRERELEHFETSYIVWNILRRMVFGMFVKRLLLVLVLLFAEANATWLLASQEAEAEGAPPGARIIQNPVAFCAVGRCRRSG
jgi:hypothetical protein